MISELKHSIRSLEVTIIATIIFYLFTPTVIQGSNGSFTQALQLNPLIAVVFYLVLWASIFIFSYLAWRPGRKKEAA